jgi:hypothetical protein
MTNLERHDAFIATLNEAEKWISNVLYWRRHGESSPASEDYALRYCDAALGLVELAVKERTHPAKRVL